MTLGEFRAWLNGYECSFDLNADGYWPNAKQFTEIKEKLALVDKPPVFVQMPGRAGPTSYPGGILAGGLCAPATSNMDNWDSRDIYAPLNGKHL